MRWITRFAYGAGQTQKDLVGSVLNAFAIIYFEKCLNIGSAEVGTLLLCGQIVNAISTPLIGYLSDRSVNGGEDQTYAPEKTSKFVQYLTQVTNLEPTFRLNKRKSWHFYGSLLMTISFPCLFGQPKQFAWLPLWAKLIISGGLLILVQIGWAAVQIAHLTLLNYITNEPTERVLLVSLRYLFSSVADISTFLLSYLLLQSESRSTGPSTAEDKWFSGINGTQSGNRTDLSTESVVGVNSSEQGGRSYHMDSISIEDMPLFRNIALVLTIYGLLFVIAFQCGVPEHQVEEKVNEKEALPSAEDTADSVPDFIRSMDELHSITSHLNKIGRSSNNSFSGSAPHTSRTKPISSTPVHNSTRPQSAGFVWYDWFRLARFWVDCFTFTTIRLSVSLAMFFLSPFLLRTLRLDKASIMLVPLVIYGTNLVTYLVQQRVAKLLGRLGNPLIGITFTLAYCTMAFFYQPETANQLMVYCAAALLGIGSAFNNVSAIVVITDMIKPHQKSTAAFVHGFASFTEKVFTGVSVQLIQLSLFWIDYRHVEVFIVGGLLLIGGSLSIFNYLFWTRPMRQSKENDDDLEAKHLKQDKIAGCNGQHFTDATTPSPIIKLSKDQAVNGRTDSQMC